jgi:hypothetical protein
LVSSGRVNSRRALLDVADDAFLVDDESCPAADEVLLVEDAVGMDRLALDVAQEREGRADVLLESPVGGEAIDADAEDLSVALLEVGDISLIRLQLLRSTAGEGQHVEGQRDVLLAAEVRELDGLTFRIGEGEVWGSVADLQLRLGSGRRLRLCACPRYVR